MSVQLGRAAHRAGRVRIRTIYNKVSRGGSLTYHGGGDVDYFRVGLVIDWYDGDF